MTDLAGLREEVKGRAFTVECDEHGPMKRDDLHGGYRCPRDGRRLPDEDARQIGRWKAMKRHVSQIRRHCEPGDPMCRPRQRQALLHWAYDSRRI